jgi:hypothetical protein
MVVLLRWIFSEISSTASITCPHLIFLVFLFGLDWPLFQNLGPYRVALLQSFLVRVLEFPEKLQDSCKEFLADGFLLTLYWELSPRGEKVNEEATRPGTMFVAICSMIGAEALRASKTFECQNRCREGPSSDA